MMAPRILPSAYSNPGTENQEKEWRDFLPNRWLMLFKSAKIRKDKDWLEETEKPCGSDGIWDPGAEKGH